MAIKLLIKHLQSRDNMEILGIIKKESKQGKGKQNEKSKEYIKLKIKFELD